MAPYIIHGSGIAGLLAAKILAQRGIEFIGLEKSTSLGSPTHADCERLCELSCVDFLKRLEPQISWRKIEELPKERKSGEWEITTETEFPDEEISFLKTPFFAPSADYVKSLSSQFNDKFLLRKSIIKIASTSGTVFCQDGTELSYSKILWCEPLRDLRACVPTDYSLHLKEPRNNSTGAIQIDLELEKELISSRNTFVFPFRFKDRRLRALGWNRRQSQVRWWIFLDEIVSGDSEEVAKCIRAFKREVEKEFPELRKMIRSERIVFHHEIPKKKTTTKKLEIYPSIFYLGPELRIESNGESLTELDLIVENCRIFEGGLPS